MACRVDELVKVAASQIGFKESPAGSNKVKYNQWYYGRNVGAAWCAAYVSWAFWMCQSNDICYKSVSTVAQSTWFKNKGWWHKGAKGIRRGDVPYFDFPNDGVNRISHVGIVEGVRANGDVVTIEGNTSTSDNRNGGMVMRRVRNPKYIVGYGRPPYVEDTPVVPDFVAATVISETVIRAKRSNKAEVVRGLKAKNRVKVYSKTAAWSYVEYGGKRGYVPTKLLKF